MAKVSGSAAGSGGRDGERAKGGAAGGRESSKSTTSSSSVSASATGSAALDPRRWVEKHGDALFRYAMLHMRGNGEAAEERVQETFLAALQSKDSFRGASTERTWLIGILRHKIQDAYRKIGRENAHRSGGGTVVGGGAGGSGWGAISLTSSPGPTSGLATSRSASSSSSSSSSSSGSQSGGSGESAEAAASSLADKVFDRKGHWRRDQAPGPWDQEDPGELLEREEFRQTLEKCLSKLPVRLYDAFILREMFDASTEDVCEMLGLSSTNLSTILYRARLGLRQCLEVNWFKGGGSSGK